MFACVLCLMVLSFYLWIVFVCVVIVYVFIYLYVVYFTLLLFSIWCIWLCFVSIRFYSFFGFILLCFMVFRVCTVYVCCLCSFLVLFHSVEFMWLKCYLVVCNVRVVCFTSFPFSFVFSSQFVLYVRFFCAFMLIFSLAFRA